MAGYIKKKLKNGKTMDKHRLVMNVLPGFVVHHKDGNKKNNDPKNLQIMTQQEHLHLHGFGITIRPTQKFIFDENEMAICIQCGQKKYKSEFAKNKSWPSGYKSTCRECWNAYKRSRRKAVS